MKNNDYRFFTLFSFDSEREVCAVTNSEKIVCLDDCVFLTFFSFNKIFTSRSVAESPSNSRIGSPMQYYFRIIHQCLIDSIRLMKKEFDVINLCKSVYLFLY